MSTEADAIVIPTWSNRLVLAISRACSIAWPVRAAETVIGEPMGSESERPSMSTRAPALHSPFPDYAQEQFDRLMPPGVAPLLLFRTMAADPRLFDRFMKSGLLDKGHLSMRQREIVIDRVTARCGSEYEWGVHVSVFGKRVGLDEAQLQSLVHGDADDACWTNDEECVLIRLCDMLHATCSIDETMWLKARDHYSAHALIEIIMLAGSYRLISYLTNGLDLPSEAWAARFPERSATQKGLR